MMPHVAVLIDPKDSDQPEVFGPHVSHQAAVWAAEDVLAERFPLEWSHTREYIKGDLADADAHDVVNAWNEVASRTNFLPILRIVSMTR